jgi:hypothetical protein
MKLGENEALIAGRLTLEIHYMLRGETAQTAAGFNRQINYRSSALPAPFKANR